MQTPFGRARRASRVQCAATLLAYLAATAILHATPAEAAARHAALVVDANTGAVLHAEAADEARFPASLTKMMTLYIVFEEIEQGRLSASTRIKISQEAASAAPTKLDLEPGEDIALGDAIKALIVKSANDIAIAVAEHISGSEAKFALRMTATAQRIGMKSTVFRNASGLPDASQITTARDMVTLALRLNDDFPRHYGQFSARSFQHGSSTYRTHNSLLSNFEGADGIKTGYTRMSGFNLVTSVRRGDKRVVGAVFGGSSAGTRNATMRQIVTRALLRASTTKTRKPAAGLVAQASPAPKLKIKPAPASAPVAIARAPSTTAQPTSATAPAASIAPAETASTVPASAPQNVIQIARVRPVMVAPRVRPVAFATASASEAARPSALPEPQQADAARTSAEPVPAPERGLAPSPANRIDATDADRLTALALAGVDQNVDQNRLASWAAAALAEPALGWSMPNSAPRTGFVVLPAVAPVRALASAGPTELPVESRPPISVDRTSAPFEKQIASAIESAVIVPPVTSAQPVGLAKPAENFAAASPAQVSTEPGIPLPGSSTALLGSGAAGASPKAATAGRFQVQIGAYSTPAEAARNLTTTRERAADHLQGHPPLTLPIAKENRQLYRARFAGFDARTAASTCLELRKKQIDCFVMKAE